MLDLVGVTILALFAVLGAFRGTLAGVLRIASLAGAYYAASLGAPRVGALLSERYSLPDSLATTTGAALSFAGAYLVLSLVSKLAVCIRRRQRVSLGLPVRPLDQLTGALLGAAQGVVVALLLGLLASYLDALAHVPGSPAALRWLPGAETSRLVRMSRALTEKGAEAAFGRKDARGRMAVELISSPARALEGFRSVLTSPRLRILQEDRVFWSYLDDGRVEAALNRPSFLGIARDRTFRGQLADLGVVSPAARWDPALFRSSVRDMLEQVVPGIQRMRNDPAFQQLVQDPAFTRALESGDALALLQHPRFRSLLTRTLDGLPPPAAAPPGE